MEDYEPIMWEDTLTQLIDWNLQRNLEGILDMVRSEVYHIQNQRRSWSMSTGAWQGATPRPHHRLKSSL